MRDPGWWREFEQEYNEREERLAEIAEKHKEWKQKLQQEQKPSLWRKRQIVGLEEQNEKD